MPPGLWDHWQDLLRSTDQWVRARDAAQLSTQAQPDNDTASQRLGESPTGSAMTYQRLTRSHGQPMPPSTSPPANRPTAGSNPGTTRPGPSCNAVRSANGRATPTRRHSSTNKPSQHREPPQLAEHWSDFVFVHARSQLGQTVVAGRPVRRRDQATERDHRHRARPTTSRSRAETGRSNLSPTALSPPRTWARTACCTAPRRAISPSRRRGPAWPPTGSVVPATLSSATRRARSSLTPWRSAGRPRG